MTPRPWWVLLLPPLLGAPWRRGEEESATVARSSEGKGKAGEAPTREPPFSSSSRPRRGQSGARAELRGGAIAELLLLRPDRAGAGGRNAPCSVCWREGLWLRAAGRGSWAGGAALVVAPDFQPDRPPAPAWVIDNCVAAAGFSIGEYAALVFAGALDYAEALYAVKVRAEAMQEASEAIPSGMLSVIGRPRSDYFIACSEARAHCKSLGIENPVCEISNYLFPDSRVIAGHLQALEFLQRNSKKYAFARVKILPVSGAFHTRLMEPAVEPLSDALKSINIQKPLVPVYSNVDGQKYTQPKQIQRLLAKQLVLPVKWEQTMHSIYERSKGTGFPCTYEVGPGKQLGAILKSCNLKAWKSYTHFDVSENEAKEET